MYPTTPAISGIAGNYDAHRAQNYQNPCQDAQPPQPTRLSSIAAHQESLNQEVSVLVDKFDRLADRLCGAQPKEAARAETGLRGAISGLANVIEGHQEHAALLVNRLRTALERLETL